MNLSPDVNTQTQVPYSYPSLKLPSTSMTSFYYWVKNGMIISLPQP